MTPVGVIKRLARDDIEIGDPGKDTYRYRTQGASAELPLAGLLRHFENIEEQFLAAPRAVPR